MNQHGLVHTDRQVVGDRVLIHQQPASPPAEPQIIVLSDQMLDNFPRNDKYVKCLAMFGYSLVDYTRDINDKLIDLSYPYIIIFLGTMQLGLFEASRLFRELSDLMQAITTVNNKSHVMVSGLVPRPMDYGKSRRVCERYNMSY